jgi:hypothetical protein
MTPLAIDLFCGLGGWTEGLLVEGYTVVGFDIERHVYGEARYPAQLVLQDVLTIHGSQFAGADLIVASPPCQAYSYRAMPWKRAKALPPPDNSLFDACFRIQQEACEAAGRHIPLVVENVRGAQPYVGRARWHFGSFYLWGDVPALMPIASRIREPKVGGFSWSDFGKPGYKAQAFNTTAEQRLRESGVKVASSSGRRTDIGNGVRFTSRDCGVEGVKQAGISGTRENGKGDRWFQDGAARHGSKSTARKAASAHIAKIPTVLSRHIARMYHPANAEQTA